MRHPLLVLLATVLLMLQGCASSVLTAPCHDPKVSNRTVPFAYLVVLPYVQAGSGRIDEAHVASAQALTGLAGLQGLEMAARSQDLHVTLLRDEGRGCSIDAVYRAFTTPGGKLQRKLMSSTVLFWGEVFEEDERVLVQSHLRVLWSDRERDRIEVAVATGEGDAGATFVFRGELPYATLSFPPRSLPALDVPGSARRLLAGFSGREQPADGAAVAPVPAKFVVLDRRDDWVLVQDAQSSRQLWVHIGPAQGAARQLLPEFSFAQAMAGYVVHRQLGDARSAQDIRQRLDEFRQHAAGQPAELRQGKPLAMARVIEATLALPRVRMPGNADDAATARRLLDEALVAMPDHSAVLNLSAMSRLHDCCGSAAEVRTIHERFERARSLDSGNAVIARNLLQWYQLLERLDDGLLPAPRETLKRHRAELESLLGG